MKLLIIGLAILGVCFFMGRYETAQKITQNHFTKERVMAALDGALTSQPEILALCFWEGMYAPQSGYEKQCIDMRTKMLGVK